jgi:CheY-like chemotaxis protein
MEILRGLDIIKGLELQLSSTYEKLSEHFSESDKELSAFFYNLSLDESNHANFVTMQKRMVRGAKNSFAGEISLEMKEIETIESACQKLELEPPGAEDALAKTYQIESSAAEFYAFSALNKTNKDMSKFLMELAKQFGDHYETVLDFVVKKGIKISRIEKERMRLTRVPYNQKVLINDSVILKAADLSQGGMYILTAKSLGTDTLLDVEFKCLDQTIRTKAKVQFEVKGVGIGLMFTDLKENEVSILKEYINQFLAEEKKDTLFEKRLLFVDSLKSSQSQFYGNSLIAEGMKVVSASGAVNAMLLFNKEDVSFDLIILYLEDAEDSNMKLLDFINESTSLSNIPVITITTSYDEKFEQVLIERGVSRVLKKMSASPNKLLENVKELLKSNS